ncbi:MAG TPA: ribonuclease T [Thermopetrobacter sp.]|nr:ribonuclease T [Thermopetrobacter sp.]
MARLMFTFTRAILTAWLGLSLLAAPAAAKGERPGLFDYYVLALSWSPTFCMSARGKARRDAARQCAPGAALGFVVHGLWPQFRRGWPSSCRAAQRFVPDRVIREVLDVMPAKGLVIHQWRKHGTCSGLSPRAYFALTERLFRSLTIPRDYIAPARPLKRTPEQIRADFARANPDFPKDGFAVVCRGRGARAWLRELRVCFSPTGRPSRCGLNERDRCRARLVTIPPVR